MDPDTCLEDARAFCTTAAFLFATGSRRATTLINQAAAFLRVRSALLQHLPVPTTRERVSWLLDRELH